MFIFLSLHWMTWNNWWIVVIYKCFFFFRFVLWALLAGGSSGIFLKIFEGYFAFFLFFSLFLILLCHLWFSRECDPFYTANERKNCKVFILKQFHFRIEILFMRWRAGFHFFSDNTRSSWRASIFIIYYWSFYSGSIFFCLVLLLNRLSEQSECLSF